MFILSWVLIGAYSVVLLPYLWSRYRLDEHNEIRSISAMICQFRPLGHFFMSLGNLMLFEIMTLEHKEVAWVYWCALQLVLCFDIDEHKNWHFFWLFIYISMLLLFWGQVCMQHDMWVEVAPTWVLTIMFAFVWFFNLLYAYYKSKQPKGAALRYGRWDLTPLIKEEKPASEAAERWKYHSLQSTVEILWAASVVASTAVYEYYCRTRWNVQSDSYH